MNKNHFFLTISLFCLLALPVLSSVSIQAVNGQPYIDESENDIRIGNDHIELIFDKSYHGGISAIIDKETGIDLFPDKSVIPTLYLFFMDNGTGTEGALQWQAYSTSYNSEIQSSYARLTIINQQLKGYDIQTQTTITIYQDSPYAQLRLTIENNEEFIIENTLFPLIWGLGKIGSDASDDCLFYPGGDGVILHDPLSYIDDSIAIPSGMYPGSISMQVLCHYDPDETGLYFAAYDTQGHPKKINYGPMEWDGINHLATSFELFIPEHQSNDLIMDYDIIVGTFHGDWYQAADQYKQWAETTPFVSKGKISEEKDIPSWFLNTSIIQLLNIPEPGNQVFSLEEIVEIADDYAQETTVDTTILIMGWEQHGTWIGPNYYPPIQGEQAFEDAMDGFSERGHHGFIYISGTVWRITREDIGYENYDYFNTVGLPWVALQKDGTPNYDLFYDSIGWKSARMDPMTDFWHDMVVENALEGIRLGVDVVQIDEFPISAIIPCYNASHGHHIGYSKEIGGAYCSILDDIRTEGRLINPDCVISIEEPCEFYIPYIDTYVSRDNAPESLLYIAIVETYGEAVEFIPFFSYVYHEYITSFGEGIGMDKGYAESCYNQMARSLAKMCVTGEIMKVGGTSMQNWEPDLCTLFKRTALATSGYAHAYLIDGVPLIPPEIDVPKKKIDWYNSFAEEFGRPLYEPVVFPSAWRADDGTKGYVFVNWDRSSTTFDVTVDDAQFDGNNAAIKITRNGEQSIPYANITLPQVISLTLDANDVVLVELIKAVDSNPPDSPVITGPIEGETHKKHVYQIQATDPDDDLIQYIVRWGDGTLDQISEFVFSTTMVEMNHTFTKNGDYAIMAKARDEHGLESAWTTLEVTMSRCKFWEIPFFKIIRSQSPIFPFFNHIFREY